MELAPVRTSYYLNSDRKELSSIRPSGASQWAKPLALRCAGIEPPFLKARPQICLSACIGNYRLSLLVLWPGSRGWQRYYFTSPLK
jgi:hypothetical protein